MSEPPSEAGVEVLVQKRRPNALIPVFAQPGDAGADCAISAFFRIDGTAKRLTLLESTEVYALAPGQRVACGLGFATALPEGYYAQVVPRSGNALWRGLSIVNTPGTIDAGYRNEWLATVINLGTETQELRVGDRICQAILRQMVPTAYREVAPDAELPVSVRGLGGFGSTGR
jgi:dUTP pyrophosphatase